jgi:hypothetical protein
VPRTLRRLFLTLFLRGRSSRGLNRKSAPGSIASKQWVLLLLYALFGLSAFVYWKQPIFILSAGLHATTFMFVGLFIASSAGEVLFNQQESDILLHRPVTSGALLWAKVSVLLQVALWVSGAFNLTGLIVGSIDEQGSWLYLPTHAASTVLEALFCTGSIVLIYQLCLRWLGRERLEGIMTATQVVATLSFVLAGQILPRALAGLARMHIDSNSWGVLLLPPAWFAGLDDAIAGKHASASWELAAIGVVMTAVILWLAFSRLSASYGEGLQRISEFSVGGRGAKVKGRWLDRLTSTPPFSWWLRAPTQRAIFKLTIVYVLRDRDVKLRVYPGIAPIMVLPFLILFQQSPRELDFGGIYIAFAGLFLAQVPLLVMTILRFSQQWQASDLFRAVPVEGPVPFCEGASKAAQFIAAIPLLLAALIVAFHDWHHLERLALLLPGLIAFPVYALIPCVDGEAVPLSLPTEEAKAAGRGLKLVGAMLLSFVLAALGFVAWNTGWFVWFLAAELVFAAIFYVRFKRESRGVRWPALE